MDNVNKIIATIIAIVKIIVNFGIPELVVYSFLFIILVSNNILIHLSIFNYNIIIDLIKQVFLYKGVNYEKINKKNI